MNRHANDCPPCKAVEAATFTGACRAARHTSASLLWAPASLASTATAAALAAAASPCALSAWRRSEAASAAQPAGVAELSCTWTVARAAVSSVRSPDSVSAVALHSGPERAETRQP